MLSPYEHFFENDLVCKGDFVVALITCKRRKVPVGEAFEPVFDVLVIMPLTDKINFAYPYIVLFGFLFNIAVEVRGFAADKFTLLFTENGLGDFEIAKMIEEIEQV